MKISIQGQKASYSHIATNSLLGSDNDINFRTSFKKCYEDLKNNEADAAVIPFENSTYGSVFQNYDFITEYGYKIIGEIYLKINFHLITHPEVLIGDISDIYTHPVAIGQISTFLNENPKLDVHEYSDTAGAVKMIKDKEMKNYAAAASRMAAEIYEMSILKENIHENPKNFTRFFLLTRDESHQIEKVRKKLKNNNIEVIINTSETDTSKTSHKTTLEFVLGEESGSLYKVLRSFADRNISLTKIESRPIINTEWEYRFYLDAIANIDDEKMQNALNEVKDYVADLKILGSYKIGDYIDT